MLGSREKRSGAEASRASALRRAGGPCKITDSAVKSVSSGGPFLKHVIVKTQISPRKIFPQTKQKKKPVVQTKEQPGSFSLLSPQPEHQLSALSCAVS